MKTNALPFMLTTFVLSQAPLIASAQNGGQSCSAFPAGSETMVLVDNTSQGAASTPLKLLVQRNAQHAVLFTTDITPIAPNLAFGIFSDLSPHAKGLINAPGADGILIPSGAPPAACPIAQSADAATDGGCPVCLLLMCLCIQSNNPSIQVNCFEEYPVWSFPFIVANICDAAEAAQAYYDSKRNNE